MGNQYSACNAEQGFFVFLCRLESCLTFCDGLCYEAADNIAIAWWLTLLMVDVDFCTDAHPLYAQMRCTFPPEFRAVFPLSL